MKKLMCFIASLFILCHTAIAESEPTVSVNAFEFADLYSKRISDFAEMYGIDASHDYTISNYYVLPPLSTDDSEVYAVNVPAGSLYISMPDFKIIKAETLIFDRQKSDPDDYFIDYVRSAMFYSVLEYDAQAEDLYKRLTMIDPEKYPELLMHSFNTLYDTFMAKVKDHDVLNDLVQDDGNAIHIMSGNYDYSLRYTSSEYEGETLGWIQLVAEIK